MFKACEHDDAQNRSGWIRDFEVNRAKCLIKASCTVGGIIAEAPLRGHDSRIRTCSVLPSRYLVMS